MGSGPLTSQRTAPPHPSSEQSGGHIWTDWWYQKRPGAFSKPTGSGSPSQKVGEDLGCPQTPGWDPPPLTLRGQWGRVSRRAQRLQSGKRRSRPGAKPRRWAASPVVPSCPSSRAARWAVAHLIRPRARRRDHQHEPGQRSAARSRRQAGRAPAPRSGHSRRRPGTRAIVCAALAPPPPPAALHRAGGGAGQSRPGRSGPPTPRIARTPSTLPGTTGASPNSGGGHAPSAFDRCGQGGTDGDG